MREINKISVPPTDYSGWQVVNLVQRTNNKGGSCVVRGGQVLLSVPPVLCPG